MTASSEPQPSGLWSRRRAGVLLHPTSLPGEAALGADARRFVDLIADAGFSVWQVLPLGPVDASLSPYLLKSVNAGNTELLDPSQCHEPTDAEYAAFFNDNSAWVEPYALFVALHDKFDDAPWWEWPAPIRDRRPRSVAAMKKSLREPMRRIVTRQLQFERQWSELKRYAHERDVLLVGDLPFYVDHDSVEVWWHRELFKLDDSGQPERVAGVPPDYFSEDGQRWGNPVYDWDAMRASDYRWWCDRIGHQLHRFDAIRIDHFRALQACWEIPADSPTAREGHWEPVPGDELLRAFTTRFGDLPLFAEDLGTITPEVLTLRDEFGLPGMLVLQFGFDGMADNPYLPENHVENAVVYSGTHDNDTTVGWFESLDDRTREILGEKLENAHDMPAALIRAAYASPARLAVLPMQDLLSLGTEARMNVPGTETGNWQWRFEWADVPGDFAERFRELAARFHRR